MFEGRFKALLVRAHWVLKGVQLPSVLVMFLLGASLIGFLTTEVTEDTEVKRKRSK